MNEPSPQLRAKGVGQINVDDGSIIAFKKRQRSLAS
jgi:hypothetical protein